MGVGGGDISFEKKHYKINFQDKEVGVMERKNTQGSAHQNFIFIKRILVILCSNKQGKGKGERVKINQILLPRV